jgi:ribA/ribD-fused uncharacterized protein
MSEIREFSGDHRFLSNFQPINVEYEGAMYPSVEHAYQAAKTLDPEERDIIRSSGSASMAKKLGRHVKVREDWEHIKIAVMTELVYKKFLASEELTSKLLDTRDAALVEGNWWGDRFWGVCNGVGYNHLGRILMAVRKSLREERNEHGTP